MDNLKEAGDTLHHRSDHDDQTMVGVELSSRDSDAAVGGSFRF